MSGDPNNNNNNNNNQYSQWPDVDDEMDERKYEQIVKVFEQKMHMSFKSHLDETMSYLNRKKL